MARLFCCNETYLSVNFTVSTSVRVEQNQSVTKRHKTWFQYKFHAIKFYHIHQKTYDSMPDLGEIRVYQRADFQSGSRVLKKVF